MSVSALPLFRAEKIHDPTEVNAVASTYRVLTSEQVKHWYVYSSFDTYTAGSGTRVSSLLEEGDNRHSNCSVE